MWPTLAVLILYSMKLKSFLHWKPISNLWPSWVVQKLQEGVANACVVEESPEGTKGIACCIAI